MPDTISIDARVPGSVPMSMPAVLGVRKSAIARQPDNDATGIERSARPRLGTSDRSTSGKRKLKRIENASMSHNPHSVRPTKNDMLPQPPASHPTFVPTPRPFERQTAPPATVTGTSSDSAASGLYHLSLKGVRRSLKSARGGAVEETLRILENEIRSWVTDNANPSMAHRDGRSLSMPSSSSETEEDNAVELVSSTHSQLVFIIASPYTRFIMHCLARYYQLPSFSRPYSPTDARRVTHVLRPQMNFPAPPGSGLETPPMTEASEQSETAISEWSESESDAADWSEAAAMSEPELDEIDGGIEAAHAQSAEEDDNDEGDTTLLASTTAFAADADIELSDTDEDAASVVSSIASLPDVRTFPPRATTATSTDPTRFSRSRLAGMAERQARARRANESTSRSPNRPAPAPVPARAATMTEAHKARAKEWSMPKQSFADWLFEVEA